MFKANFIRLCNKKGESPSSVCRNVGIAPATFSCWTDESVPRKATLMRIADYLGVTVDDLLSSEKKEQAVPHVPNLTPEEMLLLQQWRNHPETQPFVRKLLDMPEPTAEDGAVS